MAPYGVSFFGQGFGTLKGAIWHFLSQQCIRCRYVHRRFKLIIRLIFILIDILDRRLTDCRQCNLKHGGAYDDPPDLLVAWGGGYPSSLPTPFDAFGVSVSTLLASRFKCPLAYPVSPWILGC